jgi:hypothetical protein
MHLDQLVRGIHRIGSKPRMVAAAAATTMINCFAIAADQAGGDRRC